jgi:peroxiredoxin
MLALGTQAPVFSLPDVISNQIITLQQFANKKALLVMFICQHCPYVQHIKKELTAIGNDYAQTELGIIAVSSNDAGAYPDDAPNNLKKFALELKLNYPLCYDETQKVAQAYTAACTPDFFLFDSQRNLVYRGQLDDSRPGNNLPVTGSHLRKAIDAILANKQIDNDQKPSVGCNIKWKPGNTPKY